MLRPPPFIGNMRIFRRSGMNKFQDYDNNPEINGRQVRCSLVRVYYEDSRVVARCGGDSPSIRNTSLTSIRISWCILRKRRLASSSRCCFSFSWVRAAGSSILHYPLFTVAYAHCCFVRSSCSSRRFMSLTLMHSIARAITWR